MRHEWKVLLSTWTTLACRAGVLMGLRETWEFVLPVSKFGTSENCDGVKKDEGRGEGVGVGEMFAQFHFPMGNKLKQEAQTPVFFQTL